MIPQIWPSRIIPVGLDEVILYDFTFSYFEPENVVKKQSDNRGSFYYN